MLKDEPDAPFANLTVRGVFTFEQHGAAIGRLQSGDDPQQRGLAASRRTEQRHELARAHFEAHVAERREAPERLADVPDVNAHQCDF